MLIKNFYKVLSIKHLETHINVIVSLNKEHDIFKGHFPDRPVTPGVCIMQITKELIEEIVGAKLFLTQAHNVKFKAIINPHIHSKLQLQLKIKEEGDFVKVKNVTIIENPIFNDSNEEGDKQKTQTIVALQLSASYKVFESSS